MRITKSIAVICYYAGIDALFYWLNRKAKRILTFHNILPRELVLEARVANGVSNTVDEFNFIVSECAKRYTFSNDLFDPTSVTITFDDGYHNQYKFAFNILKRRGIPAYFFIAGGIDQEPLVVDRLLHWIACVPIDYIPGHDRHAYWVREICPRFISDHGERGMRVLNELNAIYPYDRILDVLSEHYKAERLAGITQEEQNEMRTAGCALGWHTKVHYPLAKLSCDEIRVELEGPEEFRNVCFSYPYGRFPEVGENAVRLAKELGYPCAVSNCIDSPDNRSRYFLPRMSLPANKYLLHFQLSGAKHFLKTFHLLPVVEDAK